MEKLDRFFEFLSYPLATVSDQTITVGQVLMVPTVILVGIVIMRWFARFIRSRAWLPRASARIWCR